MSHPLGVCHVVSSTMVPGYVAPLVGHLGVHGGEPEVAGGAVEEGAEDTGGVRPGKAQPLD